MKMIIRRHRAREILGMDIFMITITDKEFKQLAEHIKEHYGIYLREEKKALVNGRLSNILAQNNFKNFSEYFKYVIDDKTGEATVNLINKITTNHTFFMREEDHFSYLRDKVLPQLTKTADKDLRIWSAGCSSGEEPYTIAMILDEYLGKQKPLWDSKILATDISNKVLQKAINGKYSSDSLSNLPQLWKANYFRRVEGEEFEIINSIKNEVIFRKFNLMEKIFPFKRKFHVIFCRNVMIYFDIETKNELVSKFYDLLDRGGYLFIGHSEALTRETTKFKYILPAIYQKQ